ncbi:MAG: hypothetical protein WD971_09575 [Pirellulales bacterium]
MTRQVLLQTLSAFAIGLLVLGLSWNQLFPPESYWSPQQAKEYQDAFRAAHAAQDAVAHGSLSANEAEFEAAHKRYEHVQSELNRAQSARDRTGKYLIVAGLLVLLSTVVLRHFWTPPADKNGR